MSEGPSEPVGVIDHYNLLERLEAAGPGDLYRARDMRLGRTVTVRSLPEDFPSDAPSRRVLLAKARELMRLSHPNIVTLFDVGQHDGRIYFAFEYLAGQTLRAEMANRQVNVRRAVEFAIQIADAVAEAHAAGYGHEGLSPEAITITPKGRAKIPAFDLATRGGFEDTPTGIRLCDYESPEEARGEAADDRSDVYSVGAVLYEMLTARRPNPRGTAAPSANNPHVPPGLDRVTLQALAPNPDSRHQSAAALAAALRQIEKVDLRDAAGEEDIPDTSPRAIGRIVVLAALMLVVLGAIAWWVVGG